MALKCMDFVIAFSVSGSEVIFYRIMESRIFLLERT